MITANQIAAAAKNTIGARVGSSAPLGQAITAIATAMIPCKECPTTPVTERRPMARE